nr:MAG TPA: hypothetical protein [Siphoviridae sp. ctngg6]
MQRSSSLKQLSSAFLSSLNKIKQKDKHSFVLV